MINQHLRKTLSKFVQDHGDAICDDDVCIVRDAHAWVEAVLNLPAVQAKQEMLLLALAYLCARDTNRRNDAEIDKLQAAIAASVYRNGGVLRVDLDEIKSLDGTMTSFVDDDGSSITYRFVDQSGIRS